MPVPDPTVDELVATLCRSHLPTIVVEGRNDMRIYRWIEPCISNIVTNILPVGGRTKLLSVYERRNEYPQLPVAFLADRDMWLFSGIPQHYNQIIWTVGYSIENDIYSSAELEKLLDIKEAKEHQKVLNSIIEWFAFEVEEYLAGRYSKVDLHCNQVVPIGEAELCKVFCKDRGFRFPSTELVQKIRIEYQFQLRGKLLFQLLVRFLSASNRKPKHSIRGLYEIACKMPDCSNRINRLILKIKRTIIKQVTAN